MSVTTPKDARRDQVRLSILGFTEIPRPDACCCRIADTGERCNHPPKFIAAVLGPDREEKWAICGVHASIAKRGGTLIKFDGDGPVYLARQVHEDTYEG